MHFNSHIRDESFLVIDHFRLCMGNAERWRKNITKCKHARVFQPCVPNHKPRVPTEPWSLTNGSTYTVSIFKKLVISRQHEQAKAIIGSQLFYFLWRTDCDNAVSSSRLSISTILRHLYVSKLTRFNVE